MSATAPTRARSVLLVDDDPTQLKLGMLRLRDAGFEVQTASGADEALCKAKQRRPDVVLSDVLMGDLDGFVLCRLLRQEPSLATVPVILLSAHYSGEPDQALAKRVGASVLIARTPDFDAELEALRNSLGECPPPVAVTPDAALYEQHMRTNAIQLSRLLGQARNAEERYRTLFHNAYDAITVMSPEGVIIEANQRWRDLIGVEPDALIGRHLREFAAPERERANIEAYSSSVARGGGSDIQAVSLRHRDGRVVYLQFSSTAMDVGGNTVVFSIGHDVTANVKAAQALAAAEEKYRTLVERIPDVIWSCTRDGSLTFITSNVTTMLGYTPEQMCGERAETRAERLHPDDRPVVADAFAALARHSKWFDLEYRRLHKDGRWIWLRNRVTATYQRDGVEHIEGMISDITDRKRLEEIARQSQKMEAIGQLTGGIAHDFNNILAAIFANVHFLLEDLTEHDPRRADAEEIKVGAERAAALTRQLLAFSRRQVLEPTVVNLSAVAAGLEKMLARLIGEDIEFALVPGDDLGSVRVDVGQLEQVVMNLVVNARDAMPTGGKIALETANVELDEPYSASHGPVRPGRYVMLAVSDTGCGMSAETKQHIFEPFFTTKEPGKGTGLGLSTCYGIVKQSGGYIWVYSELGHGTVFKIYLPRVDDRPAKLERRSSRVQLGGSETILLLEDDARVRVAVSRMLKEGGYDVLVARSGAEALELAGKHAHAIALVLSDVVMPDSSGPEFVAEILKLSPGARALYMSGYTDHAVLRHGALQSGMNFLQKPFAPATLARKIREVLDRDLVTQ